ncbi:hypothetical protein ABL78_8313 [Leptomonas seymouri]|uniref:Uncharacterized protein n=1 Tax=Leptomonas seymouri TaxID=5684 RepID=A0A0N1HSV0_LEPSE|nr:hypothetical protein ABL78_8313 [Leptomonas seymouri]|eukprot:KPI82674.1 hypothetical protein ABL78_8313 [Leptomonas seymouri]
MNPFITGCPPVNPVPHRYNNVKWYHAVNSQQKLVDVSQEITRLYCGEDAVQMSASADCATRTPPHRVFGIEADVQWHPSLETAVMRYDTVPDDTEAILAAGSPSSLPLSGNEDLFTLEVFLYSVAQAVQGWKSRAAASTTFPLGPMYVIIKLDFKAFKAAQLFLTHAAERTWAGLETLCMSPTSSRSRRRSSIRSFVSSRRESSVGGTAAVSASSRGALPPPSVYVELWWNADVVAQTGANVHPLSFAAVPPEAVQQLMAHTAQALGHRLRFGFSLGWVLSLHPVPAEVLAKTRMRGVASPVYVAYSDTEDVTAMNTFLDGLSQALAGAPMEDASDASASPQRHHTHQAGPPALSAAHLSSSCVHLFTFPLLFESLFGDEYSENEKVEALNVTRKQQGSSSAVVDASLFASAHKASEGRRVAAVVVDHALHLFHPQRKGSVSSHNADNCESSQSLPSAAATDTEAVPEPRCFPTFWKIVRRPPSATEEWQANVNSKARSYFPYCNIDE